MTKIKTDAQTMIIVFLNAALASLLKFYTTYSLLRIVIICIVTSIVLKIILTLANKKY